MGGGGSVGGGAGVRKGLKAEFEPYFHLLLHIKPLFLMCLKLYIILYNLLICVGTHACVCVCVCVCVWILCFINILIN